MSDAGRPEEDDWPSYCSNCGSALDTGDKYCSDCGHAVAPEATPREREPGDDEPVSDDGAAEGDDAAADGAASGIAESADDDAGDDDAGDDDAGGDDAGDDEMTTEDVEQREFRRRVSDYLADGWDVQYDAGDEVLLVDREYGSVGVHVLLFLFTGGFGNLVYAWYKNSNETRKVRLRADGESNRSGATTSRSSGTSATATRVDGLDADDSAPFKHYVYGVILLLSGIYVIGTNLTDFGSILFGIGLLALSGIMLPPTRERLRNRHPPTTFGPTETVDERSVAETDRLCTVCREPIDRGVVREYRQEHVFAGIPLYTMAAGENWYCDDCHRDTQAFDVGYDRFDPVERDASASDAGSSEESGADRENVVESDSSAGSEGSKESAESEGSEETVESDGAEETMESDGAESGSLETEQS